MISPFDISNRYEISVDIFSEEIGKSAYNSMIGLADRERVDEELYDDFETAKAREVCTLIRCVRNSSVLVSIGLQAENLSD